MAIAGISNFVAGSCTDSVDQHCSGSIDYLPMEECGLTASETSGCRYSKLDVSAGRGESHDGKALKSSTVSSGWPMACFKFLGTLGFH